MISSGVLYRKPALYSNFPFVIAAESTRHGGVSPAPFASLNLGLNTTDAPENVSENRLRFFHALGIDPGQVASSHQVHGKEVLYTKQAGRFDGFDALMTDQPGLFLTVTVADCTPILIYDSERQAVAAIHAGWRGTAARITEKTLEAMQRQFGTRPDACRAYIGTCIDACSFEVGAEVADAFDEGCRQVDPVKQKYLVDLKKANAMQLTAVGVPERQIEISPYSTVLQNGDYFSYRQEGGITGRMLAGIGIKS